MKKNKTVMVIVIASGLLLAMMIFSVTKGAANLSIDTVINSLFNYDETNPEHVLVVAMRFPRVVSAALIGAALATSGALMQGVTRNPLGDSGLMGISSGAVFVVALSYGFFPTINYTTLLGMTFIGSGLAAILVFSISHLAPGGNRPMKLILSGAALTTLLTALSQGISIIKQVSQNISFWTMGSVAGIQWKHLLVAGPIVLMTIVVAILISKQVNLIAIGDEMARSLGVHVNLIRLIALTLVVILSGISVAIAGMVAFVGLMVPHFCRYLVGADYRRIIPTSGVLGALLLVMADIGSKTLKPPTEIPVGAIVAILGVPVFLRIAKRERAFKMDVNVNRKKKLIGILILIPILMIVNVAIGFMDFSLKEWLDLITGQGSAKAELIIFSFRMPRMLIAIMVGMGFSVAGCILQGLTRNPLADPGILGINAGASLVVVIFIVFIGQLQWQSFLLLPLFSLLGASMSGLLIYKLSSHGYKGVMPNSLILNGIAIQAGLNAILMIVVMTMDKNQHEFLTRWQAGSIWNAHFKLVITLLPWIVIGLILSWMWSKEMNILTLGDDNARSLGLDVKKSKRKLLILAMSISAASVAVSGSMSFVGLLGPHISRRLVGNKHEYLVPVSALVGAVLMLIADMIARKIAEPFELPTGIVVAVIGAPYFFYLLMKKKT